MTKAIFFDWDGTLVDSLPLLYAAHNHVRDRLGEPQWSQQEYAQAIVYSTRELYPKLYGERAEEAQEILYQFIKEHHLAQLHVLEGALDLVEALAERGVPMGVVSNKRHDVLQREVEHLGWQKYFGIYNGAGVAPQDKPSGVPLLYALEQHPDKPDVSNIVYVGDTESDLGCARDAGCPVAYILHQERGPELIGRYNPEFVVNNLAELKEMLIEFIDRPSEKRA